MCFVLYCTVMYCIYAHIVQLYREGVCCVLLRTLAVVLWEFYFSQRLKFEVWSLKGRFWKKRSHLIHSMFAKICITVTLLWLQLFTVLCLSCCSQSSSDIPPGATKDNCKEIFHPKLKMQLLCWLTCQIQFTGNTLVHLSLPRVINGLLQVGFYVAIDLTC